MHVKCVLEGYARLENKIFVSFGVKVVNIHPQCTLIEYPCVFSISFHTISHCINIHMDVVCHSDGKVQLKVFKILSLYPLNDKWYAILGHVTPFIKHVHTFPTSSKDSMNSSNSSLVNSKTTSLCSSSCCEPIFRVNIKWG